MKAAYTAAIDLEGVADIGQTEKVPHRIAATAAAESCSPDTSLDSAATRMKAISTVPDTSLRPAH